jgi:hypothetical protein
MEYQIDGIPGFESRKVVVQSAGYLAGAKLLVDGDVIKNNWGKYTLRRNDGTEVQARLQSNLIDPVPQLVIGKQKYFAVKPLEWYELVWAGWPIFLLFIGGAIGAIFGILAAYSNSRIFRSDLQPVMKYVLTAVVSGAFIIVYLIVAVLLTMAVNNR